VKKHNLSFLVLGTALLFGTAAPVLLPLPARADSGKLLNRKTGIEFQPGEAGIGIFREIIIFSSAALDVWGGHVMADIVAKFSFSEDGTRISLMQMRSDYDSREFIAGDGIPPLGGAGQLEGNIFKIASLQELVGACIAARVGAGSDSYTVEFGAQVEITAYGKDDDDWGFDFDGQHIFKTIKIPIRLECKEVLPPTETYAKVKPIGWSWSCPEGFTIQGRSVRTLESRFRQRCAAPGHRLTATP